MFDSVFGSAADSEVGDGLIGLWSDGRPAESYPETGFKGVGRISNEKSASHHLFSQQRRLIA
jgi:hypothetical protein